MQVKRLGGMGMRLEDQLTPPLQGDTDESTRHFCSAPREPTLFLACSVSGKRLLPPCYKEAGDLDTMIPHRSGLSPDFLSLLAPVTLIKIDFQRAAGLSTWSLRKSGTKKLALSRLDLNHDTRLLWWMR